MEREKTHLGIAHLFSLVPFIVEYVCLLHHLLPDMTADDTFVPDRLDRKEWPTVMTLEIILNRAVLH